MNSYSEGILVVVVCLTILNISIFGIVVYYISELRKENKLERFKVTVLIESMIEIFESKYKLYDEDEKGGIGPGD